MNTSRVIAESAGPIVTLTLHRPEVHNAFDEAMIADLTDALHRQSADAGVRVIVLTGAGASFCAGADLDWMRRVARYSREENVEDARKLQGLFAAIAESPKVTIARVNGAALGGGAGVVAACDIAIAVDSAKIGFTEVRLGLAPAVISPYVLRKIGYGAASALFLTGDRITASEALQIGLLNRVVPPSEMDQAVDKVAGSVLQASSHAIAETKRLLRDVAHCPASESAERTVSCIADLRASEEGREGIRAFLEKRRPSYANEQKEAGIVPNTGNR
jgi:methylglutaconyl-CoA hydratase